jgi:hypothetical protein
MLGMYGNRKGVSKHHVQSMLPPAAIRARNQIENSLPSGGDPTDVLVIDQRLRVFGQQRGKVGLLCFVGMRRV